MHRVRALPERAAAEITFPHVVGYRYEIPDDKLDAAFGPDSALVLSAEDVPAIPQRGQLSGADIEGMVGRAWRTSLLAGADDVTREALAGVIATFMPSTQGLERELQETAAMLECTDSQFLPPAILEKMAAEGGRGKLQARLTALKQIVKDL